VGQRLEGSVVYGGNAQRPQVVGPRVRIHTRRNRGGFVTESQGMRERQPLLGGQGLDPVNACRLFPLLSWVTLRTARSFADQDFINSRWSVRTVRLSPRREARERRF